MKYQYENNLGSKSFGQKVRKFKPSSVRKVVKTPKTEKLGENLWPAQRPTFVNNPVESKFSVDIDKLRPVIKQGFEKHTVKSGNTPAVQVKDTVNKSEPSIREKELHDR